MKDDAKDLTRREFLGGAALGVAGAGIGCGSEEGTAPGGMAGASGSAGGATGGGGGAAGSAGGGAADAGPAAGGTRPDASGDSSPPLGTALVGIVKASDLDAAVARAVELAGGLEEIQPGQTVFIKPNAVSDRAVGSAGIRTSPAVLAAVVRLVKQRRPGRIIVGDRSARQFPDTARIFQVTGLGDAALAAGADEIFAARSPSDSPAEWVLMQPPGYAETWAAAGGIQAMRRIIEADHLINVPTCKNHRYALFSLAMKNFIGAIGDDSRGPIHFAASTAANFGPIGRDIALLNQMFKPLITILDATTALINGGPAGDGSDAVRTTPGLIIASKDRVALDAAGVSLLKLELSRTQVPSPDPANSTLRAQAAWAMPQIQNAIERGLGVARASDVELRFDGVADAAAIEAIFRG